MRFQLADEVFQAKGNLVAGLDGLLQRRAILDESVEMLLLLAKAEENFLRRLDVAVFDGAHYVEGILRGQHQHRGDIVHELMIDASDVRLDAGAVDAEFQR